MLVWILLPIWIGLIFYFGTGRWGRAQTQAMIDRWRRNVRFHAFLNRHHGKLRASFHYLEYGGLSLILYGILNRMAGHSSLSWDDARAAATAALAAFGALLDELHQLRSGTRQFRLIDFLHSCCGTSLALLLVRYSTL